MNTILSKLPYCKIKISWNKNPILMEEFLKFIQVPLEISRDHLGSDNGWTLRYNNELDLKISGGITGGKHYLDSIQLGYRLQNEYHNYVNPFYLYTEGIMTREGYLFFLDYYRDDLITIKGASEERVNRLLDKLREQENIVEEVNGLL